jgi:hypothetical protein
VFTVNSFAPLYGKRFPNWSTVLEFVKWDGARAVLWIHDVDDGGGGRFDPEGIRVSVDLTNWNMAQHGD